MQPRERLNPKEIEVATMVWKGQTNRDIANEIGTTEILQWDCFYGNLNLREREGMLKK